MPWYLAAAGALALTGALFLRLLVWGAEGDADPYQSRRPR